MAKIKPITTKVQFLMKTKTDIKPISKLMTCLFLFFYGVFALDFGFIYFESPTMKKLVKLFSLAQSSVLTVCLCHTLLFTHSFGISLWYAIDVLMYYFLSVILLQSKYSFRDFQLDLHSFDLELQVDSDSYKAQYSVSILFLCIISYRSISTLSFWTSYDRYRDYPAYMPFGYTIALVGFEVVLLVYSFLFHSVYYRMKEFTSFVQNGSADVVTCQYLYKNIVEMTERAKKTFDLILVVALVYGTFDMIATVYLPFAQHEALQTEFERDGSMIIGFVFQELVLLLGSSFTAGRLSSQVDRLKLVLYDLLVKDQKHAVDIRRFISYIDARPLRFKVWMVIPLDWTLPVIIVNISVTYLIVMIQFTQK